MFKHVNYSLGSKHCVCWSKFSPKHLLKGFSEHADTIRNYTLPHIFVLCTHSEGQICLPPADASTPTVPWLFPCTHPHIETWNPFTVLTWSQLSLLFLLYLSLSSFTWSIFNSLRRSLRIFFFFSLSVCLFGPVCVCWWGRKHTKWGGCVCVRVCVYLLPLTLRIME